MAMIPFLNVLANANRRYMCKDPKKIRFAPLNRDIEYTAEELMTIYEGSSFPNFESS
jgi:hypothetical protein